VRALIAVALLGLGCSDSLLVSEPPPVASPPEQIEDGTGNPPDFNACSTSYFAQYFNLSGGHPDVGEEPDPDAAPVVDPDWWDVERLAFQRTDPTLTFGESWWPVDEGLAGDPAAFAVRWNAWLLADGDVEWAFALGARDDAEVFVDGASVAVVEAGDGYEPAEHRADVEGGRHTLEIRFAHRFGDADGMFFRSLTAEEDLQVCPPEFE